MLYKIQTGYGLAKTAIINIYMQFIEHLDDSEKKYGLLPRELLFIMGLYNPRSEKLTEYSWLEDIRRRALETDYIRQTARNLRQNPRQALGNHLRQLCRRRILSRRQGRYFIGRGFWTGVGNPKRQMQRALEGVRSDDVLCVGRGTLTVVGISYLKKAKLEAEFEEQLVERADAIALWMHDEYDKTERVARHIGGSRRERIFPLIIINPNNIIRLDVSLLAEQKRLWELKKTKMGKTH